MKNRRVKELFQRERRLAREIQRKAERYEELVALASSTGSFNYDQDKVTCSTPDGSRQERTVIQYVELEKEIMELEGEHEALAIQIERLIGSLPEREKQIMSERYLKRREVEDIMQEFQISYETYRVYHHMAMKRLEKKIDSVNKI